LFGQARYRSLKAEKKRLEDSILADNRDWGEVKHSAYCLTLSFFLSLIPTLNPCAQVTDMAAVTKRLKDIQEIKSLALRISDLEVTTLPSIALIHTANSV
jgi:hypothetical protein